MRLLVISHKVCGTLPNAPDLYKTDGGFPLQMKALSDLFDETVLAVPCKTFLRDEGFTPLTGKNLRVVPLAIPKGEGIRRKLKFPLWLAENSRIICREMRAADAVHAPVPGDVGTIGMLLAPTMGKRLFVRHCGNWFVQRTLAEKFWKRAMEIMAGGRNVMLATGGSDFVPSSRNPNVKWIFSTSLNQDEINKAGREDFPRDGRIKLITACRLEEKKGVEIVIESMPEVLKMFPFAELDIVGGGSLAEKLKTQTRSLNLENCVTFHGKITPKAVVGLMRKAHVFCYPTQASEGFPKVVLEALACGLPVITTRVSVLPKLISQAKSGMLLDAATASELSKAIAAIFSDEEKYLQMSESAVQTASRYSLEKWRDEIGRILCESWRTDFLSDKYPKSANLTEKLGIAQ